MKPFLSYFGTKNTLAKEYPLPTYKTIIEPFAGAAGYALYHYSPDKNVILYDIDPTIFGAWDYVIKTKPEEILKLPLLNSREEKVSELKCCEEARYLIGYNVQAGLGLRDHFSSWWSPGDMNLWSPELRRRIATISSKIKHWKIYNQSYKDVANIEATWFIDPPYQEAGKAYVYGSKDIDFKHLGKWCKARKGQIIVCENLGADWLPFRRLCDLNGTQKKSVEVIYTNSKTSLEKLF